MEIEILDKKENLLLKRAEIKFKVTHSPEATPNRDKIRESIASLINTKKENIVLDRIKSSFGKPETIGYAKVYEKKEEAISIESKAKLYKNKLAQKPEKKK
ncbi:MAG: 30S ribosomal protein S24e [Candidatus Thermoplasmatota archaeon]